MRYLFRGIFLSLVLFVGNIGLLQHVSWMPQALRLVAAYLATGWILAPLMPIWLRAKPTPPALRDVLVPAILSQGAFAAFERQFIFLSCGWIVAIVLAEFGVALPLRPMMSNTVVMLLVTSSLNAVLGFLVARRIVARKAGQEAVLRQAWSNWSEQGGSSEECARRQAWIASGDWSPWVGVAGAAAAGFAVAELASWEDSVSSALDDMGFDAADTRADWLTSTDWSTGTDWLDSSAVSSGISSDDFAINPATGLPMIGGIGGLDVAGNTYGTDHTSFSSSHDFGSSSWDSGSSFSSTDDAWSSSSDSISSFSDSSSWSDSGSMFD
ncbi:hypothetical protein [Niveibacterium sp. COAC-50]|uniref:hypothetical protein n=1 Tax=Niveibacterium sp. COAC-50 TaxID=2729384 RepID=UPI001552703A|nr:hypothetical protein [Niveibacterium sp. COAC-50]